MTDVLIVVDTQNDFIDGVLGSEAAKAIIPKVVEKIKNWKGVIVATQDTHIKGYLESAEGKKLPIEHCMYKTHGWEINESVQNILRAHNDNRWVEYTNKWSFGEYKLPQTILNAVEDWKNVDFISYDEINSVTLIGLDTDICVVSNALILKAYFPEIPIYVDASCCAGSSEEGHRAALQVMRNCQIDIIGE